MSAMFSGRVMIPEEAISYRRYIIHKKIGACIDLRFGVLLLR